MVRHIRKITSILVVMAFIPTSVNLNYIPSYISNNKETLRAMSAAKNGVVDIEQSLTEDNIIASRQILPKNIENYIPGISENKELYKRLIDKHNNIIHILKMGDVIFIANSAKKILLKIDANTLDEIASMYSTEIGAPAQMRLDVKERVLYVQNMATGKTLSVDPVGAFRVIPSGISDSIKSSSAGDISKVEAAIWITPETEPEDLSFAFQYTKKPIVVINHSEIKDYLGATTERSNEQLKAFLEAGFDTIIAIGSEDYLAAGIRKFPDTVKGMEALLLGKQSTQLDPNHFSRLEKLNGDAAMIMALEKDDLAAAFGDTPLIVEVENKGDMGLWTALKQKLITLDQARAEIIRELSARQEILYEIDVLFNNIDKHYLGQMTLVYEPVQAIREAAISVELANYRRAYIQKAVANKLNVSEDRVDIIYGEESNTSDIIELGEAGIVHVVNIIDYISWQKTIKRGDAEPLFFDRSKERFSFPVLGVTAQTGVGEHPNGVYRGDIPAKLLKEAGLGIVLLPRSLDGLNRSRIIEQLREAGISYADISERGYEGPITVQAKDNRASGYISYPAQVTNISLKDDISKAVEEVKNSGGVMLWNVPLQEIRPIFEQISSKSSSAGRSLKNINKMIKKATDLLLGITDMNKLTPDNVEAIKGVIEDQRNALKEMEQVLSDDILNLYKSRNEANQIINTMNLPFELSGFMAQESEVNGILTKVAQEKIGGILIDDEAADMSQEQKMLLLSLYGKGSPICAALEEKLKVKIILSSQYISKNRMPNMIAISSREMEKAPGIMRIDVVIDDNINSFIPIGPNLVLAQQLLLYNLDGFSNDIIKKRISDIYRAIAKQPITDAVIEAFVNTKIFTLKLPPAVPVDKNYYTELEKISAYTLIAA